MTHILTLTELHRIADSTPGNEALVELLKQISGHARTVVRVDLDALLRKPDPAAGSLPKA